MVDSTPLVPPTNADGSGSQPSVWKVLAIADKWKKIARGTHPASKYGEPLHVKSVEDITDAESATLVTSKSLRSAIFVALFMLAGVVIGRQFGWSLTDSIYFSATTLVTVGYGDFSFGAEAGNMQLVGAAFVMSGVFVIGVALGNVFDAAMSAESDAVESIVQRVNAENHVQEEKAALGYAKHLHHEAKARLKWNLYFAVGELVLVIFGGAFVVSYLEGWDWRTGIYWSCVTASSVGYGDVTPLTTAGKMCATVLMLTGVLIVGNSAGLIASYRTQLREVRARKAVMTQFGTDLTARELHELSRGKEIKELGLCQSDSFVSRSEFCLYMCIKLGRVTKEELHACQCAFDTLDVTNTGRLTQQDLEVHTERQKALGNH